MLDSSIIFLKKCLLYFQSSYLVYFNKLLIAVIMSLTGQGVRIEEVRSINSKIHHEVRVNYFMVGTEEL